MRSLVCERRLQHGTRQIGSFQAQGPVQACRFFSITRCCSLRLDMWRLVPLFLGHLAIGVLGDKETPNTAGEQMVAASMQECPSAVVKICPKRRSLDRLLDDLVQEECDSAETVLVQTRGKARELGLPDVRARMT